MSWFKVDDKAHGHPKTMMAGNAAFGLWVRLGSYCSDHLTDGFVPRELADAYGTKAEIATLLRVGYIEQVEGGYQLHDFLDYNPSKAQVLEERARNAERQAKFRSGKGSSNGARNGVTTPASNSAPDPDPTRPPSTERLDTTNDDRDGGERSSSSDFDAVVRVLARTALSGAKSAGKKIASESGWLKTVRANIAAEQQDRITDLMRDGLTVPEIAYELIADPAQARWAMRQENVPHLSEVAS